MAARESDAVADEPGFSALFFCVSQTRGGAPGWDGARLGRLRGGREIVETGFILWFWLDEGEIHSEFRCVIVALREILIRTGCLAAWRNSERISGAPGGAVAGDEGEDGGREAAACGDQKTAWPRAGLIAWGLARIFRIRQ
jgi:hypothetical protein